MRKILPFLLIASILFTGAKVKEDPKEKTMTKVQDTINRNITLGIRAPEFPQGVDWFNVPRPLTMRGDLKGKIVLIDFWTFCCINCMHVLPDLAKLEKKYPNELVVVGAHSAKFANEKISENIRKSIMRYEVAHPVLNDRDMFLWQQYGVSAWPTLVLVDPRGRLVLQVSGEGNYEALDMAIAELIRIGERDGTVKRGPLELKKESDAMESEMLRFPGKVRAYPDRLIISDSNHNRILVTDLNGQIQEIIGSGEEGWEDGSFSAAQFHHPQGAVLDGDFIYVADTENHLLRRADLKNKTVETIAGTGQKMPGRLVHRKKPYKGLNVPLNSPWDLAVLDGKIYIAMAGAHQIWVYDPNLDSVEQFAGTGAESIKDGPLKSAVFSQPSGITADAEKKLLFVADSEVSAVRMIDLDKKEVRTLVGTGLFDFGDKDGNFDTALFQHGLGVDVSGGKVYFSDTYNDRIKEMDLERKQVKSIFGSGKEGLKDGKGSAAEFYEPGGLSVLGDKIYVADTNNHKIRAADLKTGEVTTLDVRSSDFSRSNTAAKAATTNDRIDETVELPLRSIAGGKDVPLILSVKLPEKFKFTPDAPLNVQMRFASDGKILREEIEKPEKNLPLEESISISGDEKIEIILDIYFCEKKDSALCYFKTVKLIQPLEVKKGGDGEIKIDYAL